MPPTQRYSSRSASWTDSRATCAAYLDTLDRITAFARSEPTVLLPSHDPLAGHRLAERITPTERDDDSERAGRRAAAKLSDYPTRIGINALTSVDVVQEAHPWQISSQVRSQSSQAAQRVWGSQRRSASLRKAWITYSSPADARTRSIRPSPKSARTSPPCRAMLPTSPISIGSTVLCGSRIARSTCSSPMPVLHNRSRLNPSTRNSSIFTSTPT